MRVLIFDLDFTLANTTECLPYLTTSGGRGQVVAALDAGDISVEAYDRVLVRDFNSSFTNDLCAVVVSDSPKSYCIKVLDECGYDIEEQYVFGSQGKPMVDFDQIIDLLVEELDVEADDLEFLVIGDSPKDIYFAHRIEAPSIFAAWGTRHDLELARQSMPTRVAQDHDELRSHVRSFLDGHLIYEHHDFYERFDFQDPDEIDRISLDEIGFVKEYVPNRENYRGDNDRWASRDLHWVVKPAKNYDEDHHRYNREMQLYGSDGVFDTRSLKSLAGIYKRAFKTWLEEQGVEGKVVIVPVPPSVPHECNLSSPVELISGWWSVWVTDEVENIEMGSYDVVRRILPKHPSHDTPGPRHMDDQFPTLGLVPDSEIEEDIDYVVIFDDVVTSGSHMNAVASILSSAEIIPGNPTYLGFALFKTVHPENDILNLGRLNFGNLR
jgi:hypothetical protein